MLGYKCLHWSNLSDLPPLKDPETFSLPTSIPQWPPGQGFGSGRINLGKLEVIKITNFEFIWRFRSAENKNKRISFYKPKGLLPKDFHCLGHYCQSDSHLLRGYVLVARDLVDSLEQGKKPALVKPIDFTLVWSSNDSLEEECNKSERGYFWLPQPPEGYRSIGLVVTRSSTKPIGLVWSSNEVRCVRADLTDTCENHKVIVTAVSESLRVPLFIWRTRPSDRGMWGKGVSAGTFFCRTRLVAREELGVACLKNLDSSLHAMPNVDQIQSLIQHYGQKLIFHPDEIYLPSSVSWLFNNGAVLCEKGNTNHQLIDENGSNLPQGGSNDKQFWIDLPCDDQQRDFVKRGNLESSKLYIHIKPALGGTFTDLVFWIFCPFNGPATLKLGIIDVSLISIGQHVCDWEHFTLRISNFSGELYSTYISQHSGGEWIESYDLEFVQGTNKAIVYSSKHGDASFPKAGIYLQGSTMLGIGIRNDTASSDYFVDSSSLYEIIAAEYLVGDSVVVVKEPPWLQYMREWGPKVVYDSREEVERLMNRVPRTVRVSFATVLSKLPVELSGEEGPTGPKEKNNWYGDERW